ncbi:cytochrome C assembly family protein [Ideonella livida]|uniref:Cytochrome c biogenesis protein CcsA n=1 Tax=Ideonella livida TaxID=2707176 RepID=A0A7C9TM49_9BURK|nr:cytochrome c biogenesis protein CcsA [Ideonella livida]NDY93062.1 cytochrome c biogenesis protein CcsA [Ideonella livida]
MILSPPLATLGPGLAVAGYLASLLRATDARPWPRQAWLLGWGCHGITLMLAALWHEGDGVRMGFGPVLSFTVWLVLLVHAVEARFVQVGTVRRVLAALGAAAVLVGAWFPGEALVVAHSPWSPVHWLLGIASYGLFGAAVLHGLMLDAADRQLRERRPGVVLGLPLLKLERLTFRFVEAGFVVLSLAMLLGAVSGQWRWDHKTVLSSLGWLTFAALVAGRRLQGWRGLRATRWLYAGTLLLLLAYVGSRFVMEVLIRRPPG